MKVNDLNNCWKILDCITKTKMVDDISKAFKHQKKFGTTTIDKIELKIFNHKELGLQEFVVVTYIGGSIAVRNNNMNSVAATYKAIGELVEGGYYGEVKDYQEILEDEEWELVEVDINA